jgi:hypothetical protein
VFPLCTRFGAVLSGITASFFRKGNFVVVETEGDSGVPIKDISRYQHIIATRICLHSVGKLSLKK